MTGKPIDGVVQALIEVAVGKVQHLYRGTCPDAIEGFDSRDPQCPACRILIAAQQPEARGGGEVTSKRDPYAPTDMELLRDFISVCRDMKPVGKWPNELVCAAIERLIENQKPFRFIAEVDKAPERGHNGRGGDADRTFSGPRTAPPSAPAHGTTLRFGLGAFIVNTGTSDGEPAVFVDAAPAPGPVGGKAPDVPAGTTPLLRLLFPTGEQAQAVCDALVNAPPRATVGVELSALRVQEWLHREHDILCPVQEIEQAMRTPCSCPFTERALAQQPAAVDRARFRKAPCYLCGYNGPGYFQPETHPCAALYHAAQRQEPKP